MSYWHSPTISCCDEHNYPRLGEKFDFTLRLALLRPRSPTLLVRPASTTHMLPPLLAGALAQATLCSATRPPWREQENG